MGEIVNLNKARKARDKAQAKAASGFNRALSGISKAIKNKQEAEREKADRDLDGKRREDD